VRQYGEQFRRTTRSKQAGRSPKTPRLL
jgi:hypothetical protein